jgi:hypothetical protein
VGTASTVTVDITFTDNTSPLGAVANFWAFEPTIAITQSTPWSKIIGGASWTSLQTSVLPPPPQSDTSSASQVWTPSSGEQGHTCLLALVTCNADPSGITSSTPWSSAENNYHVAWHNYDVASVSVAAVKAARNYKYSIPVLANARGTKTTAIQTRRVPMNENNALMTGVPAVESQSSFGVSYSTTSQRKSFADMPVDVLSFDITIPSDIVAGSAACFEITSVQNGTAVDGYRVLLQFV